ncbi:MAG: hypothetical protein JSW59_02290 [Phycisphaerales bacterium]|nr:MAG: hypothetical protein JSW59_02290 [Phycisphaerales bacterium]
MGKLTGILTIIISVLSGSAFGGALQKNEVARDANWIVHADYESFNKTAIGKLIRAELAAQGFEEKLKSFATVYSFHPIDDVRDVTVYGRGKDKEKAVALIDGKFEEEKLIAVVQMNAKHREIPYGDIVLHRWLHEEKKKDEVKTQIMYGCILRGRLVVMSAGLDAVKQAVDVLKGSAENAAGRSFNLEAQASSGVFFQAMATGVGEMVGKEQRAAVLRQTDELGLKIGEDEDKVYWSLGLSAKTTEVAKNVNKMLEGMIALASLAGEDQPKLAKLAGHLQPLCEGNIVHLRFESDSQSVFDFLKEQWEQKQKKQGKVQ